MLVTKAELSRLLSVSAMAVSKKCRPDVRGSIAGALRGEKVDIDHPAVRAWAAEHDVDLTERARERVGGTEKRMQPRPRAPAPSSLAPAPTGRKVRPPARGEGLPSEQAHDYLDGLAEKVGVHVEDLARMDLLQLVERWGTQGEFKDWLEAVKKIADIRSKNLTNEENEGSLISREFVAKHVISHIDASNKRLLQDAPAQLAGEIARLCRTGAPLEEIERTIRDTLGGFLKLVQQQTVRSIKNA